MESISLLSISYSTIKGQFLELVKMYARLYLMHHITTMIKLKYCCYGIKQQKTNKTTDQLVMCFLLVHYTLNRFHYNANSWFCASRQISRLSILLH